MEFAAFRKAADCDDDFVDELVVTAEFGDEFEYFGNDVILNVYRFVFVIADYQIFYLLFIQFQEFKFIIIFWI